MSTASCKSKDIFFLLTTFTLALCLSACTLPVNNTPQEYAYHLELYESKTLLGKTKEEVQALMGYPNSWSEAFGANSRRGNLWDDKMHVWAYGAKSEETALTTHLYFSDEGRVEQVHYLWTDRETDESWSEAQGSESRYSSHRM